MKFTLVTLFSLLSLATAQMLFPNLPPIASCDASCNPADICCIARCHKVPCPTGKQADDTADCVGRCPLRTKTPNDVLRYSECRENCIRSNYWSSSTSSSSSSSTSSTPSSTSSTSSSMSSSTTSSSLSTSSISSSAMSVTSGAATTTSTDSSNSAAASATKTDSSASETSSGAATVNQVVGASAVGLLGVVLSWVV